MTTTKLELQDGGHLTLIEGWMDADEQAQCYERIKGETPWRHESVTIFGKRIKQPRLTAWYGDAGAAYTYSGLKNNPLPWTDLLQILRKRAETDARAAFNSVLLNYYRDGNDAMGMHADNERELGKNPVIASVSLGAPRRFVVQHSRDKLDRRSFELRGGSLLVMDGTTQHHYKHGVPRQRNAEGRINLTFRLIASA